MASLPSTIFLGASFLLGAAAYFRRHDMGSSSTTTRLHLFMHDDYTGTHPTAARIVFGRSLLPTASSDGDDVVGTNNDDDSATVRSRLLSSPRQFGDVVVLNNDLTEGPQGDSVRVGTAQGFAVRVSEGGIVSHLTMHMVLEAGEHRGSSVTASGRIDMDAKVRESVIVGGTGKFRYARGYMLTRNYDYDLARGGVVEIDLYVEH